MSLVTISDMLANARKNHYAVGAFNIINLEMMLAIVHAAELERSPVIVQVWHGDLAHIGVNYTGAIVKVAAKSTSIPIALQLDHGQNLEQVKSCIDSGFTSVMIDLSSSSFSENLNRTKEVVREAHSKNITVEAELGSILNGKSSIEERKSSLTELDQAVQFVHETKIDALAVAIGTAHGIYSYGPEIDFDLLKKLIDRAHVPIVVHGGSFTPDKDIIAMVRMGVAKINIGTELMMTFTEALKKMVCNGTKEVTAKNVLCYARDSVENVVRSKMRLLKTP